MRDTIKELKQAEQDQINLELFGEGDHTVLKQEETAGTPYTCSLRTESATNRRGLWMILTGIFLLALVTGRINPWPWVMVLLVARLFQKWQGLRQAHGPDARPTRDAFTWLALVTLFTTLLAVGAPNLWPIMLIGMGVLFLLNQRSR